VDADADVDGDEDADPEPECTGHDGCPNPGEAQCDRGTGTCVACTEDSHCAHLPGTPACHEGVCELCSDTNETQCTGTTPHCLEAEHRCVGCTEDAHCPEVGAARCDEATHVCAPCADDTPCSRLTDTPHCDAGTCVECTSYAHCDIAAGRVCNYATHLCVNACEPCSTTANCTAVLGEGFRCLSEWVGLNHCFQAPRAEHPDCERPWISRVLEDNPPAVCAPPETTTCLGVVEFGSTGCDPLASGPCGEDSVGGDGVCIEGGDSYCAFYCTDDTAHTDCPEGTTCSGVPLACRLP
jgi:hypothetical protein